MIRECNVCHKPLSIEFFCKDRQDILGYRRTCRVCATITHRDWTHKTGRRHPYSETRNCTVFLGVHVAERLLASVFTGVKQMPYGNPGYDFICGKGYKVDVKSACISYAKRWGGWKFATKNNIIADYFACIALDNRNALNPLHFWLIPTEILSNQLSLTIMEQSVNKWLYYEKPIDKLICGCNLLKVVV